jgi:hypothetical protein
MGTMFKGFGKEAAQKLKAPEQIVMDFALAKDTGTKLEIFTRADLELLKQFNTDLVNDLGEALTLHCITHSLVLCDITDTILAYLQISDEGEVRFRVIFTPAFLTAYHKVCPHNTEGRMLDRLSTLVLLQVALTLSRLGVEGGIYNHTYSWVPETFPKEVWIEDIFKGLPDIDSPLAYEAVKAFSTAASKGSAEVLVQPNVGLVAVSR